MSYEEHEIDKNYEKEMINRLYMKCDGRFSMKLNGKNLFVSFSAPLFDAIEVVDGRKVETYAPSPVLLDEDMEVEIELEEGDEITQEEKDLVVKQCFKEYLRGNYK